MEKLHLTITLIIAGSLPIVWAIIIPVYFFAKKRQYYMKKGMLAFLFSGIILKNLMMVPLEYVPFLNNFMQSNVLIHALMITVIHSFSFLIIRNIFHKNRRITDIPSFAFGESVLQSVYVCIHSALVPLVLFLMWFFGAFEFIGVPAGLMSLVTEIINGRSEQYIPYIIYPFWVMVANYLSLKMFRYRPRKRRFLRTKSLRNIYSFSVMSVFVLIHTLLMLSKLYIADTVIMSLMSVAAVIVMARKSNLRQSLKAARQSVTAQSDEEQSVTD